MEGKTSTCKWQKRPNYEDISHWTFRPYRKFLGTRLWSPPECDKRESFQPEAATVWSLGCLLHTMLTGDIPFDKKRKLGNEYDKNIEMNE